MTGRAGTTTAANNRTLPTNKLTLSTNSSPTTWTELDAACKVSGGISLKPGPFDMSGFKSLQFIVIAKVAVTIIGNGAVLDAGKESLFFTLGEDQSSLTLESITLKNGFNNGGYGGAIFVAAGALTVKSGAFLDNTATKTPVGLFDVSAAELLPAVHSGVATNQLLI